MNAIIFVADDDEQCRRLVGDVVVYVGHRAELFANGIDLLERIREVRPDMIILDINMPRMGGVDVLKALRVSLPTLIPVIAMTASVMPSEQRALQAVGFTHCLPKPLSLKHLDQIIQEVLDVNRQERNENN